MSRHDRGEVVIGDSHEYDEAVSPVDKADIEAMILGYMTTFVDTEILNVIERWHGAYLKSPNGPYRFVSPEEKVTIVIIGGGLW